MLIKIRRAAVNRMNKPRVIVSSFMDAFQKFLSYSDGSLSVNTIASFSELKEKKRIWFENEQCYWCGNHHSSTSSAELILVEDPCIFYVVKYHYHENSDNSHSRTEVTVFVPEV